MQKAFSLQRNEITQAQQLDEERKTVLAQIGALTLDMEAARALLPQVEQRRRAFLGQLVQQYGVTEYRSARLEGGNLVCDLPDEPAQSIPPLMPVNGGLLPSAKE